MSLETPINNVIDQIAKAGLKPAEDTEKPKERVRPGGRKKRRAREQALLEAKNNPPPNEGEIKPKYSPYHLKDDQGRPLERVKPETYIKLGRPSSFTEDKGVEICQHVSEGKSLVFAAYNAGVPYGTVNRWAEENQAFREMYARARQNQADSLADQIVTIADDETISPESRRVRVEARKWVAAKLKPRVYGDKMVLSGDAENPISILAVRLDEAIARKQLIDVTPQTQHIEGVSEADIMANITNQ